MRKFIYSYRFVPLLMILVFTIFSGCRFFPEERIDEPPPLLEPPAPRTVFYEVKRDDVQDRITGLARVGAAKEESLFFTENGRVGSVFVDYYQDVEEGEPLARLEAGDLEYNHRQAYLDLKREELLMERDRELVEAEGGLSRFDWELRKIDYERTKMAFERLDKQLKSITLYAPFDGKVVALSMQEARNIRAFDEVITIADPSEITLHLNLSSSNIDRLEKGMPAEVLIDRLGRWVEAEVVHIPERGDEDQRVRLEIKDLDALSADREDEDRIIEYDTLLRTAIILDESKDALLLPRAALREHGDRTFVRIQEGETRKEIDIETGIRTTTHIEILGGLKEGQPVIGR